MAGEANLHGDACAKALHFAARHGCANIIEATLGSSDDALRWAAVGGNIRAVTLLLAAGDNIHAHHDGALRWAAVGGQHAVVRLLLAAGADPIAALKKADRDDRNDVAEVFDAHASMLSSGQRTALLAMAEPDTFVQLRALEAAAKKQRAIRR